MRKKPDQTLPSNPMIVAPCGVNCSLCRAYIREHNACTGCRGDDCNKSNASLTCSIKNCSQLETGNHQFCFSCSKYPCSDLRHLDERYRTKYGVSVIANLERIKSVGIAAFVAEETSKWSCTECGTRLCMHKPKCVNCGHTWNKFNS